MERLYLFSPKNILHYKGNVKCYDCKKSIATSCYSYIKVCCISHATNYHKRYDMTAASCAIFNLLWLPQMIDDWDITRLLTKQIYYLQKRHNPPKECGHCSSDCIANWFNNIPFCGKCIKYGDCNIKLDIQKQEMADFYYRFEIQRRFIK